MPRIIDYMTPLPLTMSEEATAKEADEFMESSSIRHLPVTNKDQEVFGVVTDREVKIARLFPGPGELVLKDLMISVPFTVTPQQSLDDVVFEMMEHKYSCALIQENKKLVGIFTEIDALRAFHDLLGNLETGNLKFSAA